MSAEFDQLVAEFERFQSKIRNVDDRLAGIEGMRAELGALEATAISPDRGVTVVAGPGGAVLDVRFTEEALRQSPQALSAALMSTLREAVAESARRQASIVEEHMGDDLGLTDQVLESQAELFGTSVEEMRSRMAAETTAAPAPPDDFSEQSFVRRAEEPPPAAPPSGGSEGDTFLRKLFDEEDH
ncbi:YbaB/EbfC family nucleoid-associated protein [Amycolatopsis sp. NPDC059021]|uniref:YbaB/EbfC family nucleoid-associated protein n=1 Tax=Amycolatopsis sp. NPDC059021 TaxID=3346704 RepID=UPI00366F8A2C